MFPYNNYPKSSINKMNENIETQQERTRRLSRERKRKWLKRQSQESLLNMRKAAADRRANETPEQTQLRRAAEAERNRIARLKETPEQTIARREANAKRGRLKRELQKQLVQENTQNSSKTLFKHNKCGPKKICQYCNLQNCMKGKLTAGKANTYCHKLEPLQEYPEFLQNLIERTQSIVERLNIPSNNCCLPSIMEQLDQYNRGNSYLLKQDGYSED